MNRRGQRLYTVKHSPAGNVAPVAALVFHHGLGSYVDRLEGGERPVCIT